MGLTQNLGRLSPSIFSDASLNIGIGAAPSGSYKFEVTGTSKVSGVLTLGATLSNGTYTYTLPAATGTLALVGGAGVGTVTSVAALTIGTSGTDLSSSVANSTTTPVITLNVPTASAANRGALSSADWTTFNNKQGTITLTTTGTSGVATFSSNTLNIPNYTITNAVTGTGTTNYLPKFTGTSTIGDSLVYDNGTSVVIGTATPATNYILTLRTQSADYTKVLDWGTAAGGSWGNMTINTSAPYQTILNSGAWQFNISGTQKMLLDASGNLGLGVTPSAWGSGSTAFQIGNGAIWKSGSRSVDWIANGYYDGTNYIYNLTNAATFYRQYDGQHQWYNAPSGTAGNAITFTQAMTLFANGNLAVGTTTDAGYKLDVNGTGRFVKSSDQIVKIETTSATDNARLDFITPSKSYTIQNLQTGAANALIFYDLSASAERMRIDSGGSILFRGGTTAANGVYLSNDTSLFKLYAGDSTASTKGFAFYVTNGATQPEAMRITSTGNVGIGTTSPSYKLSIVNSTSDVAVASFQNTSATGYSGAHILNNSGSLTGHWGYGNASISGGLSDLVYFGSIASKSVVFTTNDTERMRITSGGNVLIGTTTDDTVNKLQVNGSAYVNGNVQLTGANLLTSNQYLRSANVATPGSATTTILRFLNNAGNLSGQNAIFGIINIFVGWNAGYNLGSNIYTYSISCSSNGTGVLTLLSSNVVGSSLVTSVNASADGTGCKIDLTTNATGLTLGTNTWINFNGYYF